MQCSTHQPVMPPSPVRVTAAPHIDEAGSNLQRHTSSCNPAGSHKASGCTDVSCHQKEDEGCHGPHHEADRAQAKAANGHQPDQPCMSLAGDKSTPQQAAKVEAASSGQSRSHQQQPGQQLGHPCDILTWQPRGAVNNGLKLLKADAESLLLKGVDRLNGPSLIGAGCIACA